MPYCQLFYHLVWSTKNREPRITPEVESVIYNLLRTKAIGLGGTVFAQNGSVEHVHLVTTIPPRIAVATFVGQVKGVASAKLNKSRPDDPPFYWQEEYGAFTFDGIGINAFVHFYISSGSILLLHGMVAKMYDRR